MPANQDSIVKGIAVAISEINAAFFKTCRDLLLRPQQVFADLKQESSSYLNPYRFAFLIFSFYAVAASMFGFDISSSLDDIQMEQSKEFIRSWLQLLDNGLILLTFLSLIPTAWVLNRLFDAGYSSKDCYGIALYANAMCYLMDTVIAMPVGYLSGSRDIHTLLAMVSVFYLVWAFNQAFAASWFAATWKTLVSFLVNAAAFLILSSVLGVALGIKQGYDEAHQQHSASPTENHQTQNPQRLE